MGRSGIDMDNPKCVCLNCWNFSDSFTTWTKNEKGVRTWWYCMDFSGTNNFPKTRHYKEKGLPLVRKCPAFMGSRENTIIAKG